MGSPMAQSHLTMSDLKKSTQGHQDLEALVGPMLLLNISRKPYTGSPMAQFLDLTSSDIER